MTEETPPSDTPQTIEALQQELLELEAALQAIKAQQVAKEQAQVDELEREREVYKAEQEEQARRQRLIISRGQADPWWWVDSNFGMDA